MSHRACILIVLLSACGTEALRQDTGGPPGADPAGDPGDGRADDPSQDPGAGDPTQDPGGDPAAEEAVYAHTASELYEVHPQTLALTLVGPFGWPSDLWDSMTDIALDGQGVMIGISYTKVYVVDRETAGCTFLADLDREFNGLSFVADGDPGKSPAGGSGRDLLVAAALDGTVHSVDPRTGRSTAIGSYGGGLWSSGDLVSVDGFGTVATARSETAIGDLLVRVDTATGAATPIGDTGVADIWGLGFWGGRVYGFTGGNELVVIDPETGHATSEELNGIAWYGAGVTTAAPLIF